MSTHSNLTLLEERYEAREGGYLCVGVYDSGRRIGYLGYYNSEVVLYKHKDSGTAVWPGRGVEAIIKDFHHQKGLLKMHPKNG